MILDDDNIVTSRADYNLYGPYRDQILLDMFKESYNSLVNPDNYSIVKADFIVRFVEPQRIYSPLSPKSYEDIVITSNSINLTVSFYCYEYLNLINQRLEDVLIWKTMNNIGIKLHQLGFSDINSSTIHNIKFTVIPKKRTYDSGQRSNNL